jgi:hypothetical protein
LSSFNCALCQGKTVKNWKRRWVVLIEDKSGDLAEMYYYVSTDDNKAPAGSVELDRRATTALTTVPGRVVSSHSVCQLDVNCVA